jgi:hypothetical protein
MPAMIPFSFPGLPNVGCAFGTRESAPGNHTLETPLQRRMLTQVHGTDIVFEPQKDNESTKADGMAASAPGQALIIRTADCQPIMAAHKSGKYILALHCGWRGNRAEFPTTGIKEFCARYDLKPEDVLAVRGPSLGPARARFHDFDQHWPRSFANYFHPPDKCMHLWNLTRDQLLAAGLPPENIFSLDLCTYSLSECFYSYRRDRDRKRMENMIWLK